MIPFYRAVGIFGLAALCACSEDRHALDRHLGQLSPVTVAKLPGMGWPSGTIICPMNPYQSEVRSSSPVADRVNAFLKKKSFTGDESHWSIVVVKPTPAGDAGIEQLIFKSEEYDVINDPEQFKRDAESRPSGFLPQACLPVDQAQVLATRALGTKRKLIIFGME